jgi:phosphoribosylaminoimidazole-succinocarboxamide synthase
LSKFKPLLALERDVYKMKKLEQVYEGKAKKVFKTDDPELFIVDYKDDATAFNGLKKGTILNKGVINNRVTNYMMKMLAKEGIPTHFVEELSDRETVVKKVTIVPLEVIIRNRAAGSFSKRYGVKEGTALACPVLEYSLKDDALGDPMINDSHILALGIATKEELEKLSSMALKINGIMTEFFKGVGIELIDFKIEFGKTPAGEIILADEISPDTCRFWDIKTHEKLDKDRFRRDLGNVEGAYQEILKRLFGE